MPFAANIAVEQEATVLSTVIVTLFHASNVHQHMCNRSEVGTLL